MSSLRFAAFKEITRKPTPEELIEKLLGAVSVRSRLPGRIRFHLAFRGDEILADTLRRELQKIDTVKLEAYSERTRNALVTFDPAKVGDFEVTTALMRGIKEFARRHGDCDMDHHHHDGKARKHAHHANCGHSHGGEGGGGDHGDCEHDHSATATDAGIRKELLKLAVTGGVLGYFVYKKIQGRPIAFAGNPLLDVASLVTIASGYPIFRAGVDSVQKNRKPTDDTLISIAVIATLLMGESITGLSVVWLINLGRLLEAITLKRSRTAIKELMDISPSEAWLVRPPKGQSAADLVVRVDVEKVEKGQILRVFHGEKVPLDGRIVKGTAALREAFLTGEAIPREKTVDDTVYAGSLVEHGDIDIEVTNLANETVVARMIDAIENVRDKKAPIERIGNQFAAKFIPVSIGLAAGAFVLTGDFRRAITMLVIACPCAAGLATPTAVSASIGQAARKGILIKGGTHIEAAARIDTIIFDKTGTLTSGHPQLQGFHLCSETAAFSLEECLRLAASAEQHTTHPLGLVLVTEAKNKNLELSPVTEQKVTAGMGVMAHVAGKTVHVGNKRFMASLGVDLPEGFEADMTGDFLGGESILYLAIDQGLQGAFVVRDTIRPEAKRMLKALRGLGVQRILLASGDLDHAAEFVARQLGIEEVHSQLLPEDKLRLVEKLKAEGRKVAMVGDGINDAQALAESHLSLAMGGGHCDIAIETADITLARNDLMLVPEVLDISQKTLQTIYQNFVAAVGINALGLAYSSMGRMTPFSAAIVHNASTIAVVLNSLRLGKQVAGTSPLKLIKEVKI